MLPDKDTLLLKDSVAAWGSEHFSASLKSELEKVDAKTLPLQQALSHGSSVSDSPIEVMVIGYSNSAERITAKVGIFYHGVIAGCNCADDPTPIDETTEYCVLLLDINSHTAATRITLMDE